jgi:hypothetical protein
MSLEATLQKILWNVMRQECCLLKQKAECIVLMSEHDFKVSAKALLKNPEFVALLKEELMKEQDPLTVPKI